jgi:hypothetical protein
MRFILILAVLILGCGDTRQEMWVPPPSRAKVDYRTIGPHGVVQHDPQGHYVDEALEASDAFLKRARRGR